MKLYTEEQIRTALYLSSNCPLATNCEVLNQLTPIELPSDEEIAKGLRNEEMNSYAAFEGAIWMKEIILKTAQ